MGSLRGYTQKPCPICKETKTRLKDEPCYDCKKIYELGVKVLEKQKQSEDMVVVAHSTAYHCIAGPYLYSGGSSLLSSALNDRMRKAWGKLTLSVLSPMKAIPKISFITGKKWVGEKRISVQGHDNDSEWVEGFSVPRNVRDAFNEFDYAIRLCLEIAALLGYKKGCNILQQLNAGQLSTADHGEDMSKVDERLKELKELGEMEGLEW